MDFSSHTFELLTEGKQKPPDLKSLQHAEGVIMPSSFLYLCTWIDQRIWFGSMRDCLHKCHRASYKAVWSDNMGKDVPDFILGATLQPSKCPPSQSEGLQEDQGSGDVFSNLLLDTQRKDASSSAFMFLFLTCNTEMTNACFCNA